MAFNVISTALDCWLFKVVIDILSMNRLIINWISSLLLIISLPAFSQFFPERTDILLNGRLADSAKGYAQASGNYFLASNAVRNDFSDRLLFGGFISDDLKQATYNHLSTSNNLLGLDEISGMQGGKRFGKWMLSAGMYFRQFISAQFPGDLFKLYFSGNASFAGETAQLGNLNLLYFNTQQLCLGGERRLTEKWSVQTGISLISSNKMTDISIPQGSLYTDADGAYLNAGLQYNLSKASSGTNPFLPDGAGMGSSVSAYFTHRNEKSEWTFGFRDLGFIQYNHATVLKGDTSIRFDGIHINNLLLPFDSIYNKAKSDSISNLLKTNWTNEKKTIFLPLSILIQYTRKINNHWKGNLALSYMPGRYLLPQFRFRMIYTQGKWTLCPGFLAGGWGIINLELAARRQLGKWSVSASLIQAEHFLLPSGSTGQGLTLAINRVF